MKNITQQYEKVYKQINDARNNAIKDLENEVIEKRHILKADKLELIRQI